MRQAVSFYHAKQVERQDEATLVIGSAVPDPMLLSKLKKTSVQTVKLDDEQTATQLRPAIKYVIVNFRTIPR